MSCVFNANTDQMHLELLDVSGYWKSEHVFPVKREAVSNAMLSSSAHASDRLLGLDVIAPSFIEYDHKRKNLMPTNLTK